MMATHQFANSAQRAFAEALAARLPPPGLDAHKLDRLLALRAAIDTLRAERNHDPQLDARGVLSADE